MRPSRTVNLVFVCVFWVKEEEKEVRSFTHKFVFKIFLFGIFRRLEEKPEHVRRDKMYDEYEEESESGLGE